MIPIPPDYEPIVFSGELSEHHAGVKPLMFRTIANAVMPFFAICPECGFRVMGSTADAAAQSWNRHVRSGQPHASKS